MTIVGSNANSAEVHMYYIINPPTGANNVVASWTGSRSGWMKVRTYTGVHQTTAIGTPVSGIGTSNAPSITVTGATVSVHPRIIYPKNTFSTFVPAVVAGGSVTPLRMLMGMGS